MLLTEQMRYPPSANLSQVQTLFQNYLHTAFWYASRTSYIFDRQSCILFDHNLYSSDVSFGNWGWSGGAKVLCILHHRGVQLILAYSWARPAILVAGKGRGGMFLFLLFLHFHSCSSFFPVPLLSLLLSLLSLFSLSLGDDTKWPSRVDVSLNPNTIKALVTEVLGLPGRVSSSTENFPALKALTYLKTVRIEMVWGPYIPHNSLNTCFESILSLMRFQCNK